MVPATAWWDGHAVLRGSKLIAKGADAAEPRRRPGLDSAKYNEPDVNRSNHPDQHQSDSATLFPTTAVVPATTSTSLSWEETTRLLALALPKEPGPSRWVRPVKGEQQRNSARPAALYADSQGLWSNWDSKLRQQLGVLPIAEEDKRILTEKL